MTNLNQGQEISKLRKHVFDDGPLKTVSTIFFLGLGGLVIGIILWVSQIYLLEKVMKKILTDNLVDFVYYFNTFTSFLGLFLYYYSRPSKGKNPSISFFPKYLLVRNEKEEVEVPFKMIKRFLLLENERKVLVEYNDEYVFECPITETKSSFHVMEKPIIDKFKFIQPGPHDVRKRFPQDNEKIYELSKFSFNLIGDSTLTNVSIVNELNLILTQQSE